MTGQGWNPAPFHTRKIIETMPVKATYHDSYGGVKKLLRHESRFFDFLILIVLWNSYITLLNLKSCSNPPSLSWSIYRRSVGRYDNRHIGRGSDDISADTSVDYRLICRPIYRSRGAQNTLDPTDFIAFSQARLDWKRQVQMLLMPIPLFWMT